MKHLRKLIYNDARFTIASDDDTMYEVVEDGKVIAHLTRTIDGTRQTLFIGDQQIHDDNEILRFINPKYIRVRNNDVLSLVRSGMMIYEVDGNEIELLDYGTDRVQPDLMYVADVKNCSIEQIASLSQPFVSLMLLDKEITIPTDMNYRNLINTNGGFSLNANNEQPTSGYMVSLKETERTIPNYNSRHNQIINEACADYRARMGGMPEFMYFGAWLDDNTLYLSTSVNIEGLDEAMQLGRAENQLAIYDVKNQTSIRLESNEREIFSINGFWKDDKTKFSGFLVSSFDDIGEDDNDIFYFGMSENEIKEAIKDGWSTSLEFVITSYERLTDEG
jgi:hypothetical protein